MFKSVLVKYKQLPVAVRASMWFLICGFMQQGISVITTPVFARLLTTEQYGEYGVFFSWNSILNIFFTLNLSTGVLTQGLVKFSERRDEFASTIAGLMTTTVCVFFTLYIILPNFWIDVLQIPISRMFLMFPLIWSSSIFGIWSSLEKVKCRYRLLVVITACVSMLNPLVGLVLVLHCEDKATARIIAIVLVQLLFYIPLFVKLLREGKRYFSSEFWRYAAWFNIQLIPHFLSQSVLSVADRIMINNMVSSSKAGIYSLAYSVASIMTIFHTALMSTISPWIYEKIKTNRIDEINKVGYLSLILIGGVNLLLIIFAPEAIRVFAPKEYMEAIWVVPPIAMSNFFMYCYDLYAKFAFYHDKTFSIMEASVIVAVSNVGLNRFFIKRFGFLAAGYTTLICYVLYSIVHYILMRKMCKEYHENIKPYDLKVLLILSSLFCLFGFTFMLTYLNILIRYGLMIVILFLVFIKRKEIINVIMNIRQLNSND